MRPILLLLKKDFLHFRRDRGSLLLTFVVPFALIYLFGQIFGVNRKESGPTAVRLAVVDNSGGPPGAALVRALENEGIFRVVTKRDDGKGGERPLVEGDLRPLMQADEFRFAVVIPPDLTGGDRFGIHLKLLSDPRNPIEAQTVTGLLEKVIFTSVPQLMGASLEEEARRQLGARRSEAFNREIAHAVAGAFGGDEEEILRNLESGNFGLPEGTRAAGGGGANDVLSRIVRLDREQVAGRDVKSPMATQLVGGWAMQFLLFALVASANSLFFERDLGLFQRLLSGPVSRAQILWSKFLYGAALGLLQMLILFLAGQILFRIDVFSRLPVLAVVCLVAAAACSAFGMLLASIAKTPEMARGLATFVILLMSAIGGAWFPVSFMPEFIQRLSRFTLVYWSIDGFLQVLWERAPVVRLLPDLGILAAITAALLGAAWWRFQRGRIFE
jgi:ABC-2 type transport system permease protein